MRGRLSDIFCFAAWHLKCLPLAAVLVWPEDRHRVIAIAQHETDQNHDLQIDFKQYYLTIVSANMIVRYLLFGQKHFCAP